MRYLPLALAAVLVDLPLEGLRVASARADADGLGECCFVAQVDSAALPIKGQAFDAISHFDVLCCEFDAAHDRGSGST